MKIKCDYCSTMNNETNINCTKCGAPLPGNHRTSDSQPHTIEELKQWYKDMNLPPEEVTRFFIGKDIKEAKAFGIYENHTGDFVVYKNKADGSRAVRYQGADEAYAVNELYQKLREEIVNQKANNNRTHTIESNDNSFRLKWFFGSLLLLAIIYLISVTNTNKPLKGYYQYGNQDYYYNGSHWYGYNDTSDTWYQDDSFSETITSDNDDDYSIDEYNHSGQSFSDWSKSNSDTYSNDSWDSGWDSGDSWDSGGGDWSSDW